MWVISSAIIKLVLISALGFYFHKKNYIDDKVLNFLTFFVINITVPCLIFSHLITNLKVEFDISLGLFIMLSVIVFLSGLSLGFIFSFKGVGIFRGEFVSLVAFQNCGYLPMNIALFLFSPALREQFLTYIFLYLLGFNVIMWSVGSFFIFKKRGESFKFQSIFTPPITSTVLALILVYTHTARFVPSLLLIPAKMVGNTSFVISMLILGAWLAKVKLKGMNRRLFIIAGASFLKLIALPALSLLVLAKLKIFSLLGMFILLEFAMPSAASLPIVASLREADSEFISQGVFFTHILSIITIPLWLELFIRISGFSF